MRKDKNPKQFMLINLKHMNSKGKLLLNPEYQRESVWALSQKQLLIDSLFHQIDIPKLYFRETEKDGYQYEVVDGQQRLRTVFEFMEDDGFALSADSDDVEGEKIAGKKYTELSMDLQMMFNQTPLDIVILNAAYTDDDVEEIFLRLQNGTPLNAAEKRRAIAGSMKSVVQDLSGSEVFKLCSFKNTRFAYEDTVAKILHMMLAGYITDIKPLSIRKTYENNQTITLENPTVQKLVRSFKFINKSFKGKPSPQFKKFSLITMAYLMDEMLDEFNLSRYGEQMADIYINFELQRRENQELPEEKQNPRLAAYTNAARSDSLADMRYRHETLREEFIRGIPELCLKDPTRGFTSEQRAAIFWRDKGICQKCKAECDEGDFHADHVIPHSLGGETKISNGQTLCPTCNLSKGAR